MIGTTNRGGGADHFRYRTAQSIQVRTEDGRGDEGHCAEHEGRRVSGD